MTYQWTTNLNTPVTVDGGLGPQTVRSLQFGLGLTTVKGGGTGVLDVATVKALQVWLGVTPDGAVGPVTTKALQTKLKATADGAWGAQTTTYLQQYLNCGGVNYVPGGTVATTPPAGGGGHAAISEGSVTYGRNQPSVSSHTAVVQAAAAAAGLTYSSGWQNGYETICSRESSWDPNAVNNYDSNANGAIVADGDPLNCSRGLAQCIPSTFSTYHASGTSNDIYDAVANVAASMLYVVAVYGVNHDGSNLAANVQQADPSRSPKGY